MDNSNLFHFVDCSTPASYEEPYQDGMSCVSYTSQNNTAQVSNPLAPIIKEEKTAIIVEVKEEAAPYEGEGKYEVQNTNSFTSPKSENVFTPYELSPIKSEEDAASTIIKQDEKDESILMIKQDDKTKIELKEENEFKAVIKSSTVELERVENLPIRNDESCLKQSEDGFGKWRGVSEENSSLLAPKRCDDYLTDNSSSECQRPLTLTPFSCNVCNKTFKQRRSWKYHCLTHKRHKQRCNICKKLVTNISSHRRVGCARTFTCKACGNIFEKENYLVKHQMAHHKPNRLNMKYYCELCSKGFIMYSALLKHRSLHAQDYSFKCNKCDKYLKSKGSLYTHINSVHSTTVAKCDLCPKTYKSKDALREHIKCSHVENEPLKCVDCNKYFKHKAYMAKHQRWHMHLNFFGSCNICDKSFTSRQSLENHMLVHQGVKPFKCDVCGREFSQKRNLNLHKYVHSHIKRFYCDKCGRGFNRKWDFNAHVQSHCGIKKYVCKECGNGYVKKSSLHLHQKTHFGSDKIYYCNDCEKSFTSRDRMIKHARSHLNITNHICNVCGKAYACKISLEAHKYTHTDIIPFPCSDCGVKGLERRENLLSI